MNKQEIKERIISTVKETIGDNIYFEQNNDKWDECNALIDVNGIDHIAEQSADELIEAGYINGADFVEWLKNRVISNRDYPHLAVTLLCDDTREELSEFIDQALQEYLKGE